MADLDVQVQLSLRDDLSRPAKKAMDAVRAASRTAEGGMGGVAKQAAKAGDAVEGMGRAARDAGEATDALARSNGPRSVKQQADDQVLQNTQLLANESYFEGMMMPMVIGEFQARRKIKLNPDVSRTINRLVVTEYMNEFISGNRKGASAW